MTPKPDETAIRAALNAEFGKYGPALAAKDAGAIARLFTDNGTWVLADASSYTGRANIEAGAKKYFETFESAVVDKITIDKLLIVSDSEVVTFSRGTYTMTVKGKPPAERVNPFADYWKKGNDGNWRVAYEVNSDGPVGR